MRIRERKQAREAIVRIAGYARNQNVAGLIRELDNPAEGGRYSIVRAHALRRLADVGDSSAAQYVVPLAADRSDKVRMYALDALAKLSPDDAAPLLLSGLRDPAPIVRMVAAESLGRLHREEATEPLREALASDVDPWVRLYAVEALAEIGDELLPTHLSTLEQAVPKRLRRRSAWRRHVANAERIVAEAAACRDLPPSDLNSP